VRLRAWVRGCACASARRPGGAGSRSPRCAMCLSVCARVQCPRAGGGVGAWVRLRGCVGARVPWLSVPGGAGSSSPRRAMCLSVCARVQRPRVDGGGAAAVAALLRSDRVVAAPVSCRYTRPPPLCLCLCLYACVLGVQLRRRLWHVLRGMLVHVVKGGGLWGGFPCVTWCLARHLAVPPLLSSCCPAPVAVDGGEGRCSLAGVVPQLSSGELLVGGGRWRGRGRWSRARAWAVASGEGRRSLAGVWCRSSDRSSRCTARRRCLYVWSGALSAIIVSSAHPLALDLCPGLLLPRSHLYGGLTIAVDGRSTRDSYI
jgi:hypothetical protein